MSRVIKATYVRLEDDPIHIETPRPLRLHFSDDAENDELLSEEELERHLDLRLERIQQLERDLEDQRKKIAEEREAQHQANIAELKQMRQDQQIELIAEREEVIRQAQSEGYEMGLIRGRDEGLASVKEQIESARQALKQAALEAERRVLDSERTILDLVFALAEKVLQTELAADETLVLQQIRVALSQFKQVPQVIIKVPQQRFELVQAHLSKIKEEFRQVLSVDCIMDPTLPPTDIAVDSPFGMVDVRYDAQLEVLRAALLKLHSERLP